MIPNFIFQFETWWASLTCVSSGSAPRFVVDGQAPLRQCLHPEACNKDIELPSYYSNFHDLRKEFTACYSSQDELSPLSIQDMIQCILFIKNAFLLFFIIIIIYNSIYNIIHNYYRIEALSSKKTTGNLHLLYILFH